METKFTSGPWEAVDDIGVVNAGERQIAAVLINGNVEQREANARLIAAAPDLFEAAVTVLAGLNARIDDADPGSVPVFTGIAELSDALAKARGGQP